MGKRAKLSTKNGITILSSTIQINASKDQVWSVISEPGKIDQFHPLVKKSFLLTGQVSGVGATRQCELLPMGVMKETITEWQEGSGFTTQVIGGKMLPPYRQMTGTIELNEAGGRTEAKFTFAYKLKGGILGKLMNALFIRPQFRKAPPKYVSGLKEYVEKLYTHPTSD